MVLFPKVGRKQLKVRIAWWLMVGLLCFGVLTHLFPFYVMIITSITPAAETMSTTPTLWTFHPTLAAWRLIFQWTANTSEGALIAGADAQPFWVYFWNSFFMTAVTLIISIPIVSMAARVG
jgi:ABC-type glycerol-3-phosphate transport system permease component